MSDCPCMNPPFSHVDFDEKVLGYDETNSREGRVSVVTCKHCGSMWLHYYTTYGGFRESGRWYRGLVTPEMIQSLKPEQAPELLASLPWHFYGGSYYRTPGRRGSGHVRVDL